MTFDAQVLSVMICSPGDCGEQRTAIEQAIRDWNASHARQNGVVLMPWRWDLDAIPYAGIAAQASINEQSAGRDIVIAVFQSRLGQEIQGHPSGTASEISDAIEAGLRPHVYFSSMDHPADVDPEQLTALYAYKRSLQEENFTGSYSSINGLQANVTAALMSDVQNLSLQAAAENHGSPINQVAMAEREAILEAAKQAKRIYFDFSDSTHFGDPKIGAIKVINNSDYTITSFALFEANVISNGKSEFRFQRDDTELMPSEISPRTQAVIRGTWFDMRETEYPGVIVESTEYALRFAVAESYWTDHLGLLWTTDGGGIAQLRF